MNHLDQIPGINSATNTNGLVYSTNQLLKLTGAAIYHSAGEVDAG
jgi:hypothetical protein